MNLNVERGLISKILQTRDILPVKDNQLKANHFSGDNRLAFQYICDQVLSSGEVPTVRVFERKFPNYTLDYVTIDGVETVGNEENFQFWCNELRAKVKHNLLADLMDQTSKGLQELDTEDAYALIKKKIAYIESEIIKTSAVDITKDTESRKEVYLKRKTTQGMLGIPTGFKHLDYILKGLADATLTTIIANTGIGKTWFEVIIGANCIMDDYKVLHLITEMSEDIMRDRYDAMLYSKCYGEFNYSDFKSGTLSLEQERKYFKFLDDDMPNFEPTIIDTATGVMGVSAQIEKYKPDIVLIDGVYLMQDDQGAKDDWLRVAHITRDLKILAKNAKIPIVINTQADKNTCKKTGPELGSIMFTQAVGQDSDNVLAMYQDATMISDHEMGIKVLKQREGSLGKMTINWNFKTMDFSEIFMEKDEDADDNTVGVQDDD